MVKWLTRPRDLPPAAAHRMDFPAGQLAPAATWFRVTLPKGHIENKDVITHFLQTIYVWNTESQESITYAQMYFWKLTWSAAFPYFSQESRFNCTSAVMPRPVALRTSPSLHCWGRAAENANASASQRYVGTAQRCPPPRCCHTCVCRLLAHTSDTTRGCTRQTLGPAGTKAEQQCGQTPRWVAQPSPAAQTPWAAGAPSPVRDNHMWPLT